MINWIKIKSDGEFPKNGQEVLILNKDRFAHHIIWNEQSLRKYAAFITHWAEINLPKD